MSAWNQRTLQADFDPAHRMVRIHCCLYISQCKALGCLKRAILIAEKTDAACRHVRKIELCPRHCQIVIELERCAVWRFPTDVA